MKNIKLNNEEIRLIISGLELRNQHNLDVVKGNKMITGSRTASACIVEADSISRLIEKILNGNGDIEKTSNDSNRSSSIKKRNELTIELNLDDTDFNLKLEAIKKSLRELGEKLSDI